MDRLHSFSLVAGLALLCLAPVAHAQIALTLDNPNITVVSPDPGSFGTFFNLNGTVTVGPSYSLTVPNLGGYKFFNSSSQSMVTDISPKFLEFLVTSSNPGAGYSGELLSFSVDATTALGLYYLNPDELDGLARFHVSARNNDGTITTSKPFSVLVTPADVPEPGSVALLIGMAMSGVAFGRRRRNVRKA